MTEKKVKKKKEKHIIIAGAGRKSRELIQRLDKRWDLIIIDKDENALLEVKKIREGVRTVVGDASSLFLLKEQADIKNCKMFIALTNSDDLNYEIFLHLSEKYPDIKLITAVVEKENLERFNNKGFEAIDIPAMVSSFLVNRIDARATLATNVGLGDGEIAEVVITGTSRVLNKRLKEIAPIDWVLGAVYRDNKLILPHGDTVIKENDRVLIISQPNKINAIAENISIGDYRFPLQFGQDLLVLLFDIPNLERTVDEAFYIFEEFYAKEIEFLVLDNKTKFDSARKTEIIKYIENKAEARKHRISVEYKEGDPIEVVTLKAKSSSYGLIIIPNEELTFLNKLGKKNITIILQKLLHIPFLISNGSFPYDDILISDREKDTQFKGIEIAISIAKKTNATLSKVLLELPGFMEDDDSLEEEDKKLVDKKIQDLCELYDIVIQKIKLSGNPVKKIRKLVKKKKLLIIAQSEVKNTNLFSPSENHYLQHKVKPSVIITRY